MNYPEHGLRASLGFITAQKHEHASRARPSRDAGTYNRVDQGFAGDCNEKFPGFETDIHGLVKDASNGAVRYYVDCVAN